MYVKFLQYMRFNDIFINEMLSNKEYALQVLGIERGNAKPRKDIAKWSDVKDNIIYMYEAPNEYDYDKINGEEAKKILEDYKNVYSYEADKDTWFNSIKDVAEKNGYAREVKEFKANPEAYPGHVGDVSTVIRVAISGRRNTPDLYEIMQVLGKEKVIERIDIAISKI